MNITRIRIPSRWIDSEGNPRATTADFKLGLGPCGKVVTKLEETQNRPGFYCVAQFHEDGTIKCFLYDLPSITGRIEVTHGSE